MSRRLWIVNQYTHVNDVAGGQRHRTMARLLQAHGFEPILVLGSAKNEQPARSDLPVHVVRILPAGGNGIRRLLSMASFGWGLLRLGRLPRAQRPDVILASSPHLIGAAVACVLAKTWRLPFVLEIRDIWPLSIQVMMRVSSRHPLITAFGCLEKFLYRNSDGFVLLFGGAWDHIKPRTKGDPDHVVVPNGMDMSQVRPKPWSGRTPGQPLRIAYAGSVGIPNSLDTLVDAASMLQERGDGDQVVFDVYGEGVEKDKLRAAVDSRRLGNVHFYDPVPKSRVPDVLASADALIICWKDTDLYKFGMSPNKMSDYMAAARPIINCLDSPYDPVRLGDAGWSVAPEDPAALADAIAHIVNLPDEALSLRGQNAFRYAQEHLDWQRNIVPLVTLLRGLARHP